MATTLCNVSMITLMAIIIIPIMVILMSRFLSPLCQPPKNYVMLSPLRGMACPSSLEKAVLLPTNNIFDQLEQNWIEIAAPFATKYVQSKI